MKPSLSWDENGKHRARNSISVIKDPSLGSRAGSTGFVELWWSSDDQADRA